jgi:hypothetical protein
MPKDKPKPDKQARKELTDALEELRKRKSMRLCLEAELEIARKDEEIQDAWVQGLIRNAGLEGVRMVAGGTQAMLRGNKLEHKHD